MTLSDVLLFSCLILASVAFGVVGTLVKEGW